jgi:hypothetical protein
MMTMIKRIAVLASDVSTALSLAPKQAPASTAAPTVWVDCPVCKQSATGIYFGKIGCSRCGWPKAPGRTTF